MIPLQSFIAHFNFPLILKGTRNTYNKKYRTSAYRSISVVFWLVLIPLKVLDLLGFFYLVDGLRSILFKTRKFTDFEKQEAKLVFGDAMSLDRVRIRENSGMASYGARVSGKKHIGFVLFRTINFSRPLSYESGIADLSWLVHELVHVKQFETLGVQYIFEALRAQRNGGYNYGGIKELKNAHLLCHFNLEQQADIARDYYQALKTKSSDASVYELFIKQIQHGKF